MMSYVFQILARKGDETPNKLKHIIIITHILMITLELVRSILLVNLFDQDECLAMQMANCLLV